MKGNFWPMGQSSSPYDEHQVLFNGSNGDSQRIDFYSGFYYVRGQGAGGHGGNNNYWNNGGGGGSGAGFEGFICFEQDMMAVLVGTGISNASSTNETNTFIDNILILSGGQNGVAGTAGQGGAFIFPADPSIARIESSTIQSNGENGKFSNAGSPDDRCGGGHSVITKSGGGYGGSAESVKATQPGAGGGGQIQWGAAGGDGSYGELYIEYVGHSL